MKLAFLCFFIFSASALIGQSYIGLNKLDCLSLAHRVKKANRLTSSIKESDSSLIFIISKNSNPYTTLTLYFNKQGICNLQTQSYLCDTCMYNEYKTMLDNKWFNWKKLKDGSFHSQFANGIILDVPKDTYLTFRIRKE